jgi:hypothetical protein
MRTYARRWLLLAGSQCPSHRDAANHRSSSQRGESKSCSAYQEQDEAPLAGLEAAEKSLAQGLVIGSRDE